MHDRDVTSGVRIPAGVLGSFPGVKRPGLEVYHSLSSSVEVTYVCGMITLLALYAFKA